MKKLVLVFMFFSAMSFAQQDSQYTQYMYNTITVNPAYAGSRGMLSIFGLHRSQWVGLEGAPRTNAFSVNTPLNGNHLGLGVSIVNDKIGPTVENTFSADLSYTVPTSETFKLSFGIKGTANLFNIDMNKLDIKDQGDKQFQNLDGKFSPNIGAGVYLHSDKAYVGLSVPNFIESDRYDDDQVAIFKEKINYYFIAGYVFDINPSIQFKPALLTKLVQGAPLQVDVSGNFMFDEKFVLGLGYRWSASISAMAGFQVSEGLYVGYAYDHETTRLQKYNSGSHEIFLRFELFNSYSRITSPRFF
ncbi:PorP/SprF family type IX secretion system membrane protein [Flavobacterium sp. CF136]|jgi:type IX secretion system PorP/SprF family membrane protein|uniref:PorP/SprF family type IX secretion system membrane protein n=1 Tax=Flavobacterium sp. (strain CF136) TaxID=1144313 RepID=UPI00027163AD|nr:type IX secretion system membrane protein PorP/SprF [Flavobacterium sp. CF136]EJL59315.1 Bacteroidetes-specific putative membrane protein [Flavobacterium sp. CF136]